VTHSYVSSWLVTHSYVSSWLVTHSYVSSWLVTHSYVSSWLVTHSYVSSWLVTHSYAIHHICVTQISHQLTHRNASRVTNSDVTCNQSAHRGDQTSDIWISRSAGFPGHSFEWRGLTFTSVEKNLGLPWKLVWKLYGDSRENLLEFWQS